MSFNILKDISKLQKVKDKAKSKGDLKDVANCCNSLGELFQQQGKYEEAITEHEEERTICKKLNDTIGIGIAHRKIGEALNELGKYEEALKHQYKYLALVKSVENKLEIQRALATIGRTHFCHAEALTTNNRQLYDEALANSKKAYQKGLEVCERIKGTISERDYMQMNSRLLLNLGLVCDLQRQDSAAINFFKKSIYIGDKYGFQEDVHRCRYSLAIFYQQRKNYSQAKREAEMAEKVAFQLKDKALICDDLSLKAQLFVAMADFESARRCLLKAYRQKSPVAQDHEKIQTDLRTAIRLCKLQDECCSLASSGEEEKLIRIHEKMGDLCSSLKAYSTAVDFYLKVLEKSQELGFSEKEINPFYVSISQTYMDLKDFKNAIIYYKKELEHYIDNPTEECRTILNIANAMEEDGASFFEIESLYRQACDLAERAENPRLKANALNSLGILQESNGYTEKSQESMAAVNRICADHGIDLDEDSETSPSQNCRNDADEEEFIDLEDLIDDDSDEEESVGGIQRGRRRPKKSIEKLNMKGETALHRACIKQDITAVRMLLQQKHTVNVRDNCGWTPLHEACNHGSVEIVELLIEHGASVNDRGGKHCEGVTPLHDAASCGHLDVMEALLRNGANPLSQTDAGESVYECLLKWRLRTGGDLDSRTLQECLDMERKLTDSMSKSNQKVPSVKEVERKQNSTSALISEEDHVEEPICLGGLSEPEEDSFRFLGQRKATEILTASKSASTAAQKEYATAMKVIGSSSVRRSTATSMPVKRSRPSALLLEEEIEDDWLDKDLPSPPSRRSIPNRKTSTSSLDRSSTKSTPKPVNKLSLSGRNKKSETPQRPTPCSSPEDDIFHVDDYEEEAAPSAKRAKPSPTLLQISDESSNSNDRAPSPILSAGKRTKKPIQLTMDAFTEVDKTVKKSSVLQAPSPARVVVAPPLPSPGVLKLYVRVQDKTLLIPVERNKSVQWLSEEAARRYYQMTGLSPILSLQTSDGAVLNGGDIVGVILQDGDKIVGDMLKWDLQPLPERYANLCRQLEIARLGEVDSLLTNAHTSGKLSIGLPLGTYILPVVKALRYQESLWDLDLSGTKMDDHHFQSLCEALSTLPHLVSLDVHSNLLTASGLSKLAEALRGDSVTGLKKLQRLDLSFNPLGDGASYPLTTCLQHTTALSSLKLDSCDLTDAFLDNHIRPVLRRRQLEEISIGLNDWSSTIIRTWLLDVLDFSSLKRLSLTGSTVESSAVVSSLAAAIQSVDSCRLAELDLSHCRLTDACIDQLTLSFDGLPQLKKLVLKNNTQLSVDSFCTVMTRCQTKGIQLEELDLLGCALTRRVLADPSTLPDSDDCVRALRSFLSWSKSLRVLNISFSRRESDASWVNGLTDVWLTAHGPEAVAVQPTEHQLLLTFSKV